MNNDALAGIIEAILFVAGEPLPIDDLAHALDLTAIEMTVALDALKEECELSRRGLRVNRHGGTVQISIRPEYAPYVERVLQPAQKQSLSQAALETLSIIAYRQPVTKAEIEAIRGVKCDYSVQSLVNKQMICEVGRKEALGRPILYATTEMFLQHFGIESLDDLPNLKLDSIAQIAGEELDDPLQDQYDQDAGDDHKT